ncbi:MAG: hypothetical protein L0219_19510 [Phycisphaerales bacterium]|nr:hypothetical protein [Phycisphaerales bacterium]
MKHLFKAFGLGIFCATLASPTPALAASGLVVLNPSENGALKLSGNARAIVPKVRANSSSAQGISGSGNVVLESADVKTVGGASFSGGASCTSTVHCGAAATSDPLASVATPTFNQSLDLGSLSLNSNTTVQPGYYSGGISISSGDVTFSPGLYILDGIGLKVSGSSNLNALGVLLYFRGTGKLTLSGGAAMHLTAPTVGPHAGISIFYDRASTKPASLSGGSGINMAGVIYMPGGKLKVTGSGSAEGDAPVVGTFVVADMVEVSGNGKIILGSGPTVPTADILFD